MHDAGGLLETGLARAALGAVVFLFAPLLVIADLPLPGVVGALWLGAGVVLMLRAPASTRHAWWLRALAAALTLWLAVTAVTLFGHLESSIAVVSMAAYAGVFTLFAASVAQLATDLGQGRIARRWMRTGAIVRRAGVALVGVTLLAVLTEQVHVVDSTYSFSLTGVASLSMLTPIAVIGVLTFRSATLMTRTREALRAHLEVEPLRRLRATLSHH